MQSIKRIYILVVCTFLVQTLWSQILYTDGATFYISNGGIVFSNGGVTLTQNTSFTNEGDFTVTKNSTFPSPGNFELNTTASASGDGSYRIEQDWINDAQFNAGNSSVELYGNTAQNITSTNNTVTTFNNLTLTGTGVANDRKKILVNVDARVSNNGTLNINDRELATDANTFFVLNPATGSVTNNTTVGSEGFVSSLTGGYFSRATSSAAGYIFPTGSSAFGITRYRPLQITPSAAAANVYNARLNNYDASTDGYDRTSLENDVCATNDKYYHSIIRSAGATSANITFYYIAAADGAWDKLARWQTGSASWNNFSPASTGASGSFATVTRNAWNFPDADHPYVLSTTRPLPPNINCPLICENAKGVIFTASGSTSGYQWTFPASATMNSGQGTNNVSVDWATGTGYVYVYAPGVGGCNSLPDSCQPTVIPAPVANFSSVLTADGYFIFNDQSSSSSQWFWDFGDGGNSNDQSPFYQYSNPGTYVVSLTVENGAGCSDEAVSTVTVEGEDIFIPNTFTPNYDNINGVFLPVVRTAKEFSLSIFNRWGELIFKSEDLHYGWDGTYKGDVCQNDVYVYHLKIRTQQGDERTFIGHVTLLQ